MERINEEEGPHHLDILNCRLSFMHDCSNKQARTWMYKKTKRRLETIWKYHERPVSLAYFTVGQLNHILLEIQENYFRKTHLFCFGSHRFIVRVIPNEDAPEELLPRKRDGIPTLKHEKIGKPWTPTQRQKQLLSRASK